MATEKAGIKKVFFNVSNSRGRNVIRYQVVRKFMQEAPGSGTGKLASRYDYYVEELSDGRYIILSRPANLKNGFDFRIRVENTDFNRGQRRKRDYPKHDDIVRDLRRKKKRDPKAYEKLLQLIKRVYECEEVKSKDYKRLNFAVGYPVDLILGVVKWFFIEQDIRYWNYSGRAMLISGIFNI